MIILWENMYLIFSLDRDGNVKVKNKVNQEQFLILPEFQTGIEVRVLGKDGI